MFPGTREREREPECLSSPNPHKTAMCGKRRVRRRLAVRKCRDVVRDQGRVVCVSAGYELSSHLLQCQKILEGIGHIFLVLPYGIRKKKKLREENPWVRRGSALQNSKTGIKIALLKSSWHHLRRVRTLSSTRLRKINELWR